jgi:hypothetical protein
VGIVFRRRRKFVVPGLPIPEATNLCTLWLISHRQAKLRYAMLRKIVVHVTRRRYGNKERNDSWRRLKRCLPGRDEKTPLMLSFVFVLFLIVFFSDSSFQKNKQFPLIAGKNKRQGLLFCFLTHLHLLRFASLINFIQIFFE